MPSNSIKDLISALISIRIGSNMQPLTTVAEDYDRVAQILEEYPLGGLLLFRGGTAESCATTLDKLQQLVPDFLLIASDMERGAGQQISELTLWPHCLAFDALGAEAAAEVERFGWLSACEARELGIHALLAPVADIHRNPDNPIIATRAFGTTAERVTELTSAFVRGCRQAGMLTCAKHFPGHGNTGEDSHATLPAVEETREELEQTDLAPFRALLSQVEMVMTAHVAYPALDERRLPATLSQPILTELLRSEMGFQGVVVSDSLKMEGVRIAEAGSEAELAALALKAGVDVLLDVSDVSTVIAHLESACDSDPELQARVEQAHARLSEMKNRITAPPVHDKDGIHEAAREQSIRVARQATHVVSEDGRFVLPITGASKTHALLVNPHGDTAYTRTDVLREALTNQPTITSHDVLTDFTIEDWTASADRAAEADQVLVAILMKPLAWQSFGMPEPCRQIVQGITQARPTLVVALGTSDILRRFPDAACTMALYSDAPVSQMALTERLFERE